MKKRLWFVDDSPLATETTAKQLADDYAVECFVDGSSVIERAASDTLPDALVLDWIMPGVSGSEVLRFLRASPRTERLPIIVLTSTGNSADLVDALDNGANDYVARPCTRSELLARVGALLRVSELRERAEAAERENALLLERERAARTDAESANSIKDDFLATLSHELRTPLHSILGWVTLLKGGTLSSEMGTRALAAIERSGRAQATIIEDLLDISRIVSGKMRLDLATLDPADSIEQAIETVRPLAATKSIEIRTSIDSVGLVSGDAARIQQIAWNLLTNAVRYTPNGGTVTVALEEQRAGALLSVTDTGEGIPPELMTRMFDRFRQGDSSSTRTHGGLGLGLAIVRHLAELHGGTVCALSDGRGKGARFEVWLPLAVKRADVAPVAERRVAGALRGIDVLVVDDDESALELMKAVLVGDGATVTLASNGARALAALDRQLPDVVLSDLMMPEMDGYGLLRAVRERPPAEGGQLPIVALTAAALDTDRKEALRAGFQAHLAKPVDFGALSLTIRRLAGRLQES